MTKHIIITAGLYGVGKSYYAENWIQDHPEYTLVDCQLKLNATFNAIKDHEYVIMDYYFVQDYNANALREHFNCPVDIIVLFDSPEAITWRQVYKKDAGVGCPIDCFKSLEVYKNELSALFDVKSCRYIDGEYKEYTYEAFHEKLYDYWKPYTRNEISNILTKIMTNTEHDYHYQSFRLPYGFKMGKDSYSMNEPLWDLIKNWVDWRGKKVLDLCCNHGWFSQQVWYAGGKPTGCDLHKHAIYTAAIFAKMNHIDYPLYRCDVNGEFPLGEFDVCFLLNVLHHLTEQNSVLMKMRKYETCIFRINEGDREKVEKYFEFLKATTIPNDNRLVIMGRPRA